MRRRRRRSQMDIIASNGDRDMRETPHSVALSLQPHQYSSLLLACQNYLTFPLSPLKGEIDSHWPIQRLNYGQLVDYSVERTRSKIYYQNQNQNENENDNKSEHYTNTTS